MKKLSTNRNHIKPRQVRKFFNIEAERLIREANDNFIYFRDYYKALNQTERILEIDADHVKALILRGNLLFCLDRDIEALECFEKAISIDPYSAEAYGSKANTLDVLGKVVEAYTCCEKAFRRVTQKDAELLPSLYDQKIALLIKLKRYEEAQSTLKHCYRSLNTEDSFKIAACYRDVINTLLFEQKNRKKAAMERFTLIEDIRKAGI